MRKFLLNISISIFLLLTYFLIIGILNILFIKTIQPENEQFNILVIGDSHLEGAINPDYFKNSKNVSLSAEPYFISYWKLKRMAEIADFDTVIIGYSYHNLSEFNDYKVFDKYWATEFFKRYYSIQEYSTVPDLKIDKQELYFTLWKNLCFLPKIHHNNYIGKYNNADRVDDDDFEGPINRHFFINDEELSVSYLSKIYLDSIVDFCLLNNFVPIFLSTPLKDNYYSNIPTTIQKEYQLLKTKYKNDGVLIIDKSRDAYPDSLFLNADHINENGARRFEKELSQILRKPQ